MNKLHFSLAHLKTTIQFLSGILFSFPELQKNAVFMLSLSPHHRQDCSTRSITDQLAKQKLLFLHPPESFPVEVDALHNEKTIKKFSRTDFLAIYWPQTRSLFTGRICCLAGVEINVKQSIILASRYLLVIVLLTIIDQRNHRQSVDYLRAVIQLEYVGLGFRLALRSIEHPCVFCRKQKAKVKMPKMAELPY